MQTRPDSRYVRTNRRRLFILGCFLVVAAVLWAMRLMPWEPTAILLVWMAAVWYGGTLATSARSPAAAEQIDTISFCLDALLLTGVAFFVGGALWIGAAFYVFLAMVASSSLSLKNSIRVAGCVTACYALLVFGEVSGQVHRPEFFSLPDYTGDYGLGVVTVMLTGLTIALAVYIQQELVGTIRRSELRHRVLLESAGDMILTLDGEGTVLSLNQAVVEETGYSREELVDTRLAARIASAHADEWSRQLDLARLGSRSHFELAYKHAQGSDHWFSGTITPLPQDHAGARTLLIGRDVTKEKAAERERERLRNELAQSLRMQALGRFVSGVAHELNNPLTAILTTAEDILEQHKGTPDEKEALGIIRQQAQRSRTIVRDLLSYVRSGTARRKERIRPSVVLAETLESLRPQLDALGATLELDIDPDLEPVEIDRAGFEQVVSNLVINAAQAAGKGGRIQVSACAADGLCELVVDDNGPGIPSDSLEHIFEPFFTTRKVGQGVGLGLSLSLGIVEHYGGIIQAENKTVAKHGQSGARFIVRLPLAPSGSEPNIAAAVPAKQVAPRQWTTPSANRRVLVVDDDESIRRTLRRYLERFGWAVEEVDTANQALSLLTAANAPDRYQAVICDMKMPGMSGLDLCKKIRSKNPALSERFIMVSGDVGSDREEMSDCARGGVLDKPFDSSVLRALLERLSARAHAP